jgi:hypothetical protein
MLSRDMEAERKAAIEHTLGTIEARIQNSESIRADRRAELLELLGKLKAEVASLSQTDEEQARSIAGFAEISAHEATRADKNPQLLQHAVDGLSSSVKGFEESHPRLVQIVNAISGFLSNLGI